MQRVLKAISCLWLTCGGLLLLHGAITGGGVAGTVFGWEYDHYKVLAPNDTWLALAFTLTIIPAIVLIVTSRSSGPVIPPQSRKLRRLAIGAGAIGAASYILAGLCFVRTLMLPDPDAQPFQLVLDQAPEGAPIPEGNAVVMGIAQFGLVVSYEETNGGGKTNVRTDYHRFVPMTPTNWQVGQSVAVVVDSNDLKVLDPGTKRYRPEKEGDPSLPARSTGMLMTGLMPAFVKTAFARQGLTMASEVLVQTGYRGAGRDGWYVGAALFGLGGIFSSILAVVCGARSQEGMRH
jgi:hypothetical protein